LVTLVLRLGLFFLADTSSGVYFSPSMEGKMN